MDSKKLLESINLIREKAENNKLIVFVGLEYHAILKVCQAGIPL